MPMDTVVARLFRQAETRGDAPALFTKQGGAWRGITWKSYASSVKRFGSALLSLGFQVGDTISILGFNRPEWVFSAVGAMAVGGSGAGIYTTSSPSEIRYIAHHAESKVLVVENAALLANVLPILDELPATKRVVLMGTYEGTHPKVLGWDAFLELGRDIERDLVVARTHALEPTGVASLIYTSGTTGPPKAVMLSHHNIAFAAELAQKLAHATSADSSLSYLPLSHIAEQMFTIHAAITMGGAVYFAESLEKFPDNLKEVQPTLFFGVPRVWEKIHAKLTTALGSAKGLKKHLVRWAMRVGLSVSKLRMQGKEPTGLLAVEYKIANARVLGKIKSAIGLGRARFCVSGAAPIAKEVLEFFASLDIVVLEVYGQSEDCGPTSCNLIGRTKLGTVGPAVDGVEVKIAEDGEILVRGANVFLGYYKDEAATKETLIDGWLHSGDLGSFDAEGFLSITGRKKEIIITAGGKNIAPKNIEAEIKNHRLVSEAVVIGDRRKFLTALVTLDEEALVAFAKAEGVADSASAHQHPKVRAELQRAIDEINKELARVETVKKFTILGRPLSIETGELTPTMKVKRKVVSERFSKEIESMYED